MQIETVAVLFADVSESTQLYEGLGDTMALRTIDECTSLISGVVEENQGKVIKTIGDAVMSTFPDADKAVNAAAGIQVRIHSDLPQEKALVKLRIGVHYGQVVIAEGDVFGDSVNVAARIVKLANPGQIIISGETVMALSEEMSANTRGLGEFPIKGKKEKIPVYEVLVEESEEELDLTLMPGKTFTSDLPQVYLILRHAGNELLLHEEGRTITLGRSSDNDLVVDDKFASRVHAQVEYSHGKFVLQDQSTNGTFVLTNDKETIFLHREKLPLSGAGQISLGRKFNDESGEFVYFSCTTPED